MNKKWMTVAACAVVVTAHAALIIDYQQATVTTDPLGALTYAVDASGNLTGNGLANNAEVLTGNTAYLAHTGPILTINAWNLGTSGLTDVVADGVSTDFLEARVSGSGWDTTGLDNTGFRIKSGNGAGMVPGTGSNNWDGQGAEFMLLHFAAPAGAYSSMDVSYAAASNVKSYQVGDANVADGVGPGTFSASLAPGSTLDLLLWNDATGGAKRLQTITIDVIPEPATLGLMAAFGGGILWIRRRLAIG